MLLPRMLFRRILPPLLLLATASTGGGEEASPTTVPPEDARVSQIGEHLYRLGELRFDSESREIEIPVVVNMREGGPMEYLLVHEHGKVHESVFVTTASPLHVQIAMKLLRYREGYGDVFNRLLSPEALEREGGGEDGRGDEVVFRFFERSPLEGVGEREDSGEGLRLEAMILDAESGEAMREEPWIFTGSSTQEGTFLAEAEGSIIAVYLDHLAIFNMTREGADIDRRWWALPDAIPEVGVAGVVVIAPAGEGD